MVTAWGVESSTYAGHRLTLFRNPEITFGREKVGGIEISHMSHIDNPLTVALTQTRGKRKNFTVDPLTEIKARDWISELALAADDLDAVAALGAAASSAHVDAGTLEAIRGRYNELKVSL